MILRRLIVLGMASFVIGLPALSQPAGEGGSSPFDKLTGPNKLTEDQTKQLKSLSGDLANPCKQR